MQSDPSLQPAVEDPVADVDLRIGILGPLTVTRAGTAVELGPAMIRNLLGLLAVHPGRAVPREEIVDGLWGDNRPSTYANLIHVYTSRLRAQLRNGTDTATVRAFRGGYRLDVPATAIDLFRFDQLCEQAGWAADEGRTEGAIRCYREALGCWRGRALVDLDARLATLPAVASAERRRIEAVAAYATLCADAGQPALPVDELRTVAQAAPLHEGVHAHLMRALAATGDRAAALDTYTMIRRRLADELGVHPGAELQAEHLRLLRDGEPTMSDLPAAAPPVSDPPAPPPAVDLAAPATRPWWRHWLLPVVLLLTITAVVAGTIAFIGTRLDRYPAAATPEGVVFAPTGMWHWTYGPGLGVTDTPEQTVSARFSGLLDGDHNAGFRIRMANNPVEQPGADADDPSADGVLIALTGVGWKIEGQEVDTSSGPFAVPPAGLLQVSISADNVVVLTLDGVMVMTRRLAGTYTGRRIAPAVWQSTANVRLIDIRSNANR